MTTIIVLWITLGLLKLLVFVLKDRSVDRES